MTEMQKSKNRAMLIGLVVLIVLLFAITIIKIKNQ
jgi:hypothetical protein